MSTCEKHGTAIVRSTTCPFSYTGIRQYNTQIGICLLTMCVQLEAIRVVKEHMMFAFKVDNWLNG